MVKRLKSVYKDLQNDFTCIIKVNGRKFNIDMYHEGAVIETINTMKALKVADDEQLLLYVKDMIRRSCDNNKSKKK